MSVICAALAACERLIGVPTVSYTHLLDVIKVADRIVDLGPEGGNGGGRIVVSGTPEKVAACEKSYTGRFLRPLLERDRERMAALDV